MKTSLRKLAVLVGADNNSVLRWQRAGFISPHIDGRVSIDFRDYDDYSFALLLMIGSMEGLKNKNKGICVKRTSYLLKKMSPMEDVFTMCFQGVKIGHPAISFLSTIEAVSYCERALCDLIGSDNYRLYSFKKSLATTTKETKEKLIYEIYSNSRIEKN